MASSLGWFCFSGPNGRHICLVGEVVRCDFQKCKDIGLSTWTFPIETSRVIAAQAILGLTYLHSLGLCHGGIAISKAFDHQQLLTTPVVPRSESQ